MNPKDENDILSSLEEEMFSKKEEKPNEDLSTLSNEITQKMSELKEVIESEKPKPQLDESKLKKLPEVIRMKIPQVKDCTLIKEDGTLIATTMIDKDETEIFGETTAQLTESALRALTESAYGDCDHIILTGTSNQIVVKTFGHYIVATKLDKNTNIGMYLIKVKSLLKDVF